MIRVKYASVCVCVCSCSLSVVDSSSSLAYYVNDAWLHQYRLQTTMNCTPENFIQQKVHETAKNQTDNMKRQKEKNRKINFELLHLKD